MKYFSGCPPETFKHHIDTKFLSVDQFMVLSFLDKQVHFGLPPPET